MIHAFIFIAILGVLGLFQNTIRAQQFSFEDDNDNDEELSPPISPVGSIYSASEDPLARKQEYFNELITSMQPEFMEYKRQYHKYPVPLQDHENDPCKKDFIDVCQIFTDKSVEKSSEPHPRYQELMSQDFNHFQNLVQLGLQDCAQNLKNRMQDKGLKWIEKPTRREMIQMYTQFFNENDNEIAIIQEQLKTKTYQQTAAIDNCFDFVRDYEKLFGTMFVLTGYPHLFGVQRARDITPIYGNAIYVLQSFESMLDAALTNEYGVNNLKKQLHECKHEILN